MSHLKSQSGSVVTFVVVAVVLVGLVVGGVWVAHHRGNRAATVPHIAKQGDTKTDKKSDSSKTDTPSDSEAAKQQAESDAKKKIESDKQNQANDQTDKKADDRSSSSSQPTSNTSTSGQSTGNGGNNGTTPMQREESENGGAAALPTTGPTEDLLSSVVGLIAIIGAGYVYYHFGRK